MSRHLERAFWKAFSVGSSYSSSSTAGII
jgi:hypothetical protein